MTRPIVLLHGYSASAQSMSVWHDRLVAQGHEVKDIYVGQFVTLSNEITIKDIAEGFDRALRISAWATTPSSTRSCTPPAGW